MKSALPKSEKVLIKMVETDSEKALFAALNGAEPIIATAMAAQDFTGAMAAMAGLPGPRWIGFFEDVKINDDRDVIRRNRLNLLARVRGLCVGVADLTKVEG